MGSYMITDYGFFETDITTFFINSHFKYKGLSIMGEYADRNSNDAIAKNSDGSLTGDIVNVGSAISLQPGYVFPSNIAITGQDTILISGEFEPHFNQFVLFDIENRNNNTYVFMCYSKPEGIFSSNTVLHKSILKNNALVDDEIIFSTKRPLNASIHFGCRIAISKNYIYLSLGDRGNRNNSQNINNYEGSVIRVKFSGEKTTKNQLFNLFNSNFKMKLK